MKGPEPRRGFAATAPDAADPALQRRVYAVPFEIVWQAALALAGGRLRGWSVESADDREGVIEAFACGRFAGEHGVVIRIGLDRDAQTTVDVSVMAARGRVDLGRAGWRLRRFLRALDQAAARPRQPAGRPA
jgi:hypothetical protein